MKKNMNENFEITVDEMTEIFGDTPVEMSFREVKEGMDSFFGLMGLTVELVNLIRKDNPFPYACAYVCEHPCEKQCRRRLVDDAINICGIKRYAVDHCQDDTPPAAAEPTGKRVAVVGGGPSGLTAAYYLQLMGHSVTVFEQREKLGGMLRYGIPEFRLPKEILDRYKTQLEKLGIKIRPNTAIGQALTIDDLQRDGYEAIFIGTGVWRPKKLGIPGESLGNVHFAIDYLVNPDVYNLGSDLVVIGAGNSAMDVARTALRKGVKHVTVFCRSYHVAASVREKEYAIADGVDFLYAARPVEITDGGVWYQLATFDEEGKVSSLSEPRFFPSTSVVVAISQGAQNRIVSTTTGLKMTDHGLLATDDHGETTRPGIFASGDVVLGARTVVEAVRYSKQVADEMDAYLQQQKRQKAGDATPQVP